MTDYDLEKLGFEETRLNRPDQCWTDGDWRDTEDPLLKLELWALYIQQEHLWNDSSSDATRYVDMPKADLRAICAAIFEHGRSAPAENRSDKVIALQESTTGASSIFQ